MKICIGSIAFAVFIMIGFTRFNNSQSKTTQIKEKGD